MRLHFKLDSRTILITIVIYMLAFYAWNFSVPLSSRLWSVGCNLFSTIGSLTAAIWLAMGSRTYEPTERRFWLIVTFSAFCYFCGDATWFAIQVVLSSEVPSPGLPDVLYLLCTLSYIIAFILKILKRKLKFSLDPMFDIAIIMAVAISMSWEFIVKPIFLLGGGAITSSILVSLVYITSDLVLLLGALCLYWVIENVHSKKSMLCFIFGMILQITADSVYYSPFANSNGWIYAIVDPLYTLSLFLIAFGGYLSRKPGTKNRTPENRQVYNGAIRLALPYVMIIILLVTLFLSTGTSQHRHMGIRYVHCSDYSPAVQQLSGQAEERIRRIA